MRIDGPGRPIGGGGGVARQGGSGAAFRVADGAPSDAPRQAAPLRSAPGLDALLAMQTMPDVAVERRKRAVKRGRNMLDALDDLKLALLDGRADATSLHALKQRLDEAVEATGDLGLDDTLAAIDLRVAVEIAKRKG